MESTFATELFQNIYNILTDNSKVLIIMHIKKTNICYDQEEEIKELQELKDYINNLFEIEEELISDASWKFLIIKKNTIK